MKRIVVIVASCLAMGSVGCIGSLTSSSRRASVILAGIVSKNSAAGNYAYANFNRSKYDHGPVVVRVANGRRFETYQALKIKVQQQTSEGLHDYFVIMGGDVDLSVKAVGLLRNSVPTLDLEEGWAFISGQEAYAKSDWVSAGAEGTTFVLESVSPTVKRYYLLAENDATASLVIECGGDPLMTLSYGSNGRYVEIDSGCAVPVPKDIVGDPVAEPFINSLKEIAVETGWAP